MRNVFMFFAVFTFFITSVASAFEKITEDNFREKVSIFEGEQVFYSPKQNILWDACVEAASEMNTITFYRCKLEKFEKKSNLDIKEYEIGFSSYLPLKKEWMETVIQEFLNQEKFAYFTVYDRKSSIYNVDLNKPEDKKDYKKCEKNTNPKDYECLHTMHWNILAYNDPNALRNGVIYDYGKKDDGYFMFYDIYMGAVARKDDLKKSIYIYEPTKLAWEVSSKVDPDKKNAAVSYEIQHLNSDEPERNIDYFSQEFDRCKNDVVDKNNGRFSKAKECYCNCVQNEINKNLKKTKYPFKHVVNIMEVSRAHCDWLNSTMVNIYTEDLNELRYSKIPLSKYDDCRYRIFAKYVDDILDKNPINICNIDDIVSHMTECSAVAFGK